MTALDFLSALALVVIGAMTTRSVWLLGFRAGVALERARGAMERSAAVLQAALDSTEGQAVARAQGEHAAKGFRHDA